MKTIIAILLISIGLTGFSQTSISTSSGTAKGSGGTASYTIGQVAYVYISGTNGSATQGVQQSYIITAQSGLEEKWIDLSISAYPNPATDILILKIENFDSKASRFNYVFYDMNGILLQTSRIENEETTIMVGNLLSGIYFVKVTDTYGEIKTFKIIKN